MNKAISRIEYKEGFKVQLIRDAKFETNIKPKKDIWINFIRLCANGHLTIDAGYAWDGPSGPTLDTNDFMRGSLAHDAIAELCRQEFLDADEWFDEANRLLLNICKQDGMPWWRRRYIEWGINTSICRAAFSPEHKKKVYQIS